LTPALTKKVRYVVIKEILKQNKDEKSIKEAIKQRLDDLVPKHIIGDDIVASINYANCLAYGIRQC